MRRSYKALSPSDKGNSEQRHDKSTNVVIEHICTKLINRHHQKANATRVQRHFTYKQRKPNTIHNGRELKVKDKRKITG